MPGVNLYEAARSAQWYGTVLYDVNPLVDRGLEGATSINLRHCPCTQTCAIVYAPRHSCAAGPRHGNDLLRTGVVQCLVTSLLRSGLTCCIAIAAPPWLIPEHYQKPGRAVYIVAAAGIPATSPGRAIRVSNVFRDVAASVLPPDTCVFWA